MNPFLMRRMFMTKEENIILIKSDALEQGTLNASNGQNFPSDYRVRTKDFISVEKGLYKITCEGAKQGNVVEYEENGTWKKNLVCCSHVTSVVYEFYRELQNKNCVV